MAKFCTRCGRPLAEGEVCTCGQTQGGPDETMDLASYARQTGYQQQTGQSYQQTGQGYQQSYQQQAGQSYQQQGGQGYQQGGQGYQQQAGQNYQQQYQGNPYGQYQGGPNRQGQRQYRQPNPNINMAELSSKAKTVFGDMLQALKRPVAYARVLTNRKNSRAGAEMIIFKGIVSVVVAILCSLFLQIMVNSTIRSAYGSYSALAESSGLMVKVSVPWFWIVLFVVIMTFGADFLQALWLKLLTRTNKDYLAMTVNVGVRCAFDTAVIVVFGVFAILACLAKNPALLLPAVLVYVPYAAYVPYMQFAAYSAVLNDDPDSKVRRYVIAMVLQIISMMIIGSIFGSVAGTELAKAFSSVFN